MNVEETIRVALINYPSIFPNALSVYEHLFCVNGNGYMWSKGELISLKENSGDIERAILKEIKCEYENLLRFKPVNDTIYKRVIESNRDRSIENIKLIFDTNNRLTDFTIPYAEFQFAEINEYSKILNLPSDITPDWLDAVKWMCRLLSQYSHRIRNFKPEMLIWVDESIKKVGN